MMTGRVKIGKCPRWRIFQSGFAPKRRKSNDCSIEEEVRHACLSVKTLRHGGKDAFFRAREGKAFFRKRMMMRIAAGMAAAMALLSSMDSERAISVCAAEGENMAGLAAQQTGTGQEAAQAVPILPPSLGAVAVGEMRISGDDLEVSVAVQVIPGTAALEHINIQFRNLENDRSVTKILRERDYVNGVYAGWLDMSVYEPAGTYVLDKVILRDEDGVYRRYCREEEQKENENYAVLPMSAAFRIDNGITTADETAPVLGAVAVSPVHAAKETEITVAAAVTDDFSGVDSVTVRFENEKGKAVSVDLKQQQGELYSARIKKSQTGETGTYRVKKVTVSDKMGNSETYYGGDGPFASNVYFVIQ